MRNRGEEAPLEQEFYELREATTEELAPEQPVERRDLGVESESRRADQAATDHRGDRGRPHLAETLRGRGRRPAVPHLLRWGMFYSIPEPELVIRDGSGRELPRSPQGSSGSEREADGAVEVRDLPEEVGELEVEVTRLVSLVLFDEEVAEDSYVGPWTFRFSI
jgi:hypothetical protein